MRALVAALGFLTRLPVPRGGGAIDVAAVVRLYPVAGLAVGAIVAGAWAVFGLLDPWLGALAGLVGWVWVTGALHLDGLGDAADGLGAAHGDRTRLLAVMAEPQVGGFGVVAIVLQLAAKLVLLHLLRPTDGLALLLVPAAARIGPLCWARYLTPLRPTGLGAAIAGAVRRRDLVGWGALLAGAAVAVPILAVAPILFLLVGRWFRRRAGGVTGDLHGAGIELVETGLLLALTVQAAV